MIHSRDIPTSEELASVVGGDVQTAEAALAAVRFKDEDEQMHSSSDF